MALLLILLAAILLLAVLLFTVKSKVDFVFDSTDSDMHVALFWLYPFLKSIMTRENNRLIMTVYVFNKKILTKQLDRKRKLPGSGSFFERFSPTDIHVDAQYGFRDPFITGLATGAITMASEYLNVESLNQKPDYLASNDYINLDATAKINLGRSLMKLI